MKIGSFSFVLTKLEYGKFNFKLNEENKLEDEDKLFKLTILNYDNDELSNIDILEKKNKYLCRIYKESIQDINVNLKLKHFLLTSLEKSNLDFEHEFLKNVNLNLKGYFVENLGSNDLFDTLTNLINFKNNIWSINTLNKLNKFITHMLEALLYLKKNGLCHFDIKPENIMYLNSMNLTFGERFKLIDFGFSEKYPFKKYLKKICGSAFYTPYPIDKIEYPSWAINGKCNDWIHSTILRKKYHYVSFNKNGDNYKLLYKTDVYSMGVTFNQLIYYIERYNENKKNDKLNLVKLNTLITHMTHCDINKRYYSEECLIFLENKGG